MPDISAVIPYGNSMVIEYDDGTRVLCISTGNDRWLPIAGAASPFGDGDNGGDGTSADDDTDPEPDAPPAEEPDPVKPPVNGIDLYNPWKKYGISQSWEGHINTAGRGGIDMPIPYGTPIKSPADGTLHISGGSGEYAAGWVGSAGRRSILYLDKKFTRKKPRGSREAQGPMRAIVFQHQSKFGRAKHYNRGDILGYTGASANGADYGGDVHLHVHGLDAGGARTDLFKYF
jgi:hypothetical protein